MWGQCYIPPCGDLASGNQRKRGCSRYLFTTVSNKPAVPSDPGLSCLLPACHTRRADRRGRSRALYSSLLNTIHLPWPKTKAPPLTFQGPRPGSLNVAASPPQSLSDPTDSVTPSLLPAVCSPSRVQPLSPLPSTRLTRLDTRLQIAAEQPPPGTPPSGARSAALHLQQMPSLHQRDKCLTLSEGLTRYTCHLM